MTTHMAMSDQSIAAICTATTVVFTVIMNVAGLIVSRRNGKKLNQVKGILLNGTPPKLNPFRKP